MRNGTASIALSKLEPEPKNSIQLCLFCLPSLTDSDVRVSAHELTVLVRPRHFVREEGRIHLANN